MRLKTAKYGTFTPPSKPHFNAQIQNPCSFRLVFPRTLDQILLEGPWVRLDLEIKRGGGARNGGWGDKRKFFLSIFFSSKFFSKKNKKKSNNNGESRNFSLVVVFKDFKDFKI